MKPLAVFLMIFGLIGLSACEKELKEHKVPPGLKKEMSKLKKKNDPEARKLEVVGTVTIDPALVDKAPARPTLFITARPKGETSGPPLAVKRYDSFLLPFDFTLGPADTMMKGAVFEGELTITARLDQDGNAMSTPGDISGTLETKAGDKQARILLDHYLEPKQGERVTGTIDISEALKSRIPKGGTLFIIARRPGSQPGMPPLAVRRLPQPKDFPFAFYIGQENMMIQGSLFEGEVELKARLDSDGNAMPEAGDLEGTISTKAGEKNVQLLLNTVVGG